MHGLGGAQIRRPWFVGGSDEEPTMKTKVAINGLGRIGRAVLKLALEEPSFEVVAVSATGQSPAPATRAFTIK